ncbi:MAG TPA: enoyl-CoA hydratase-related protein [Chloroflexota bacterium]|nr:enoyl-CoA hydratase-related protein [Chloroflexota bacterium]
MAIRVNTTGPVATVTLARPALHNAFDPLLIEALRRAFESLATDQAVRVVVLAGDGPSFCAGADLNWMRDSLAYTVEENHQDALRLADMLDAIASCPHPVIARVHGAALGGGAGLVAACDIAVATPEARFGFTEARLGLAPAVISPYVLARIGPGHARALFLTAERFDAARAFAIGLVHRVVPSADLDSAVEDVVRQLLAAGPEALRACKALAQLVPAMPLDEARGYTAALIARLRTGAEGQEGIRAFLEKRPPAWKAD